jgi:EAL domain-containing protein (putative c-di-GMP-specific phosphodiesterase class I)
MLKIDQSFVQDVTRNEANASITRVIISLAHSMNLTVLAEGVETDEELALLRGQGCDEVQGHFFGRPMAGEEFARLLSREVPRKRRKRAA